MCSEVVGGIALDQARQRERERERERERASRCVYSSAPRPWHTGVCVRRGWRGGGESERERAAAAREGERKRAAVRRHDIEEAKGQT